MSESVFVVIGDVGFEGGMWPFALYSDDDEAAAMARRLNEGMYPDADGEYPDELNQDPTHAKDFVVEEWEIH